jgi:hypothetical protein
MFVPSYEMLKLYFWIWWSSAQALEREFMLSDHC